MPDPRPDLTEFQKQTEAIHAFLSSPEAVTKLEKQQVLEHPEALSPMEKGQPIEFTKGHLQLEWIRGSWLVQNWKDRERVQPLWIVPEENLLSALIRPPYYGEIRSIRLEQPTKNGTGLQDGIP